MNTIAIVCSEFNKKLVKGMLAEAIKEFDSLGKEGQWKTIQLWVFGSGDIPSSVDFLLKSKKVQAVLALGVIIKGQTGHYDFLCGFLQRALWDLQKNHALPLVFSVLLLENRGQAKERLQRGAEGMRSLIQMIEFQENLCKKDL